MHISKSPSEKARTLIIRYNSDGVVPFPFEKILLDERNLRIVESEKLSVEISGMIAYENGVFTILVNRNDGDARKYFTIARELGHYYLHRDFLEEENVIVKSGEQDTDLNPVPGGDGSVSLKEQQANIFAVCLIMPEKLVRKAWKTLNSIEECARLFEVSPTTMSMRLEGLGLLGQNSTKASSKHGSLTEPKNTLALTDPTSLRGAYLGTIKDADLDAMPPDSFIAKKKLSEKTFDERLKDLQGRAIEQDISLKKYTHSLLFLFLAVETVLIFLFALFQGTKWPLGFHLEEWSFKLLVTATIGQITYMLQVAVKHLFPGSNIKK